jgi:hypothetical protein
MWLFIGWRLLRSLSIKEHFSKRPKVEQWLDYSAGVMFLLCGMSFEV